MTKTVITTTQVVLNRFVGYPRPTYKANTPICDKCGQIDIRIPRMGIYHVCPDGTSPALDAYDAQAHQARYP